MHSGAAGPACRRTGRGSSVRSDSSDRSGLVGRVGDEPAGLRSLLPALAAAPDADETVTLKRGPGDAFVTMESDDIETVAVLGAGSMGHGIAEVAALAGYDVNLRDVKEEFVQSGYEDIEWSLEKLAEK